MPPRRSPRAISVLQAPAPTAQRHNAESATYVAAHAPLEAMPRRGRSGVAEFRILDNTADGPDSAYARRVATLFRFADRLAAEGALGGPLENLDVQHRLQQCAYIAQQMGAGIDYEFGFMRSGAFSADLAVDIYQRDAANGGFDPFAGMTGGIGGFLGLVRGHTTEWLRLAALAVRPAATPPSKSEFVDRVARGGSANERRLAAGVFDAVSALLGAGEAGRKT